MTHDEAKTLVTYDPETGTLFSRFGRKIGYLQSGYVVVTLKGRQYLAHRLIWFLQFGYFPAQLDHINGNRRDNRLINLREVSVAENNRNMCRRKDNASGCTGVDFERGVQKWRAQIAVRGKDICLGRFNDFADAVTARKAAERQYGFHENHGRPAKAAA